MAWNYLWKPLSIPKAVISWQNCISKEEITIHFGGKELFLDIEELNYYLEMLWGLSDLNSVDVILLCFFFLNW